MAFPGGAARVPTSARPDLGRVPIRLQRAADITWKRGIGRASKPRQDACFHCHGGAAAKLEMPADRTRDHRSRRADACRTGANREGRGANAANAGAHNGTSFRATRSRQRCFCGIHRAAQRRRSAERLAETEEVRRIQGRHRGAGVPSTAVTFGYLWGSAISHLSIGRVNIHRGNDDQQDSR